MDVSVQVSSATLFFVYISNPSSPHSSRRDLCKVIKERQLRATTTGVSEQLLYIALQEPGATTKLQFSHWTSFLIED